MTPSLAHAFFNGEPGSKSAFFPPYVNTVIWRLDLLRISNPVVDTVKALVNAMMDRMMDTINFMMIIANCWFQYLIHKKEFEKHRKWMIYDFSDRCWLHTFCLHYLYWFMIDLTQDIFFRFLFILRLNPPQKKWEKRWDGPKNCDITSRQTYHWRTCTHSYLYGKNVPQVLVPGTELPYVVQDVFFVL